MEFECYISGRVGNMVKVRFYEGGYGPWGWWLLGTRGIVIDGLDDRVVLSEAV